MGGEEGAGMREIGTRNSIRYTCKSSVDIQVSVTNEIRRQRETLKISLMRWIKVVNNYQD